MKNKTEAMEELFERGFFHDIYTEALRLQKENEELKEQFRHCSGLLIRETALYYNCQIKNAKLFERIRKLKASMREASYKIEHKCPTQPCAADDIIIALELDEAGE
jgi:SMC interacting uncharacterized protein involved in chromosome segregation